MPRRLKRAFTPRIPRGKSHRSAFTLIDPGLRRDDKRFQAFTLIELLVVIAILAVLAVVVVLTLNPAGLLQEARDSNRISDMATLKSALSLYLADVPTPSLGTSGNCYLSIPTNAMTVPISGSGTSATTSCQSWFAQQSGTSSTFVNFDVTSTPIRNVTGTTGWIPVNLSQMSAGAPFALWPIDPVNSASDFYSYEASSTGNVFKIGMFMESTKFKASGTADIVSTDGGNNNFIFEGGSNLGM